MKTKVLRDHIALSRSFRAFSYLALPFAINLLATCLSAQSTNIAIGGTPLQTGVKRLGINLGGHNYYDSGQILKNLTMRNPGFEPSIYQSTVQCAGTGSTTGCVDSLPYGAWPSGFWPAGSQVRVISGAAAGCTTSISTFTGPTGSYGGIYTFSTPCAASLAAGDYFIVSYTIPGNPTQGWWPSTGGNGSFAPDTTDLTPGTTGVQALQMIAPTTGDSAQVSSFFDSTGAHSFVTLNGSYQVQFDAKGLGGSQQILVTFSRNGIDYVSQRVSLTGSWSHYTVPFTASESGAQTGPAQLSFSTIGADSLYLDNVATTQTATSSSNPTVFRDSVVTTLQELNPGIIRMWDGIGLGNTLDNMLVDQFGRMPSNYSAWYSTPVDDASYGLFDFLQLVQTVGTSVEPWIVVPITFSPAEASNLIDYLSGGANTVYGAKRIAQGQTAPWTSVFPKIHLEFGNEAWNTTFQGGIIQDGASYGARAQTIFAAMRSNPNYVPGNMDLIIGAQAANSYSLQFIQNACQNNDSLTLAPYMMNNVSDTSSTANLYLPTFAEPQAFYSNAPGVTAEGISNGWFTVNNVSQTVNGGEMYLDLLSEANTTNPKPISIYEENLSTIGGSISQSTLNTYVSSLGAGLASVSEQLLGIQNGILNQNLFSLTQWEFKRPDGSTAFLWGSVVDMGGATNLRRPQYLAEQLANSAISPGASMLQTIQTGANPTWNQSTDNTVGLNNANYIQSFAFSNGAGAYSAVLLNLSLTNSLPVTFSGANAPSGAVELQQLTSEEPTDNNENSSVVAPVSSSLSNFNPSSGISLPPYSMTVLTWSQNQTAAPVISSVAANSITTTSATITWTTDQASSSQAKYGTTTSYGSTSTLNSSLTTTHSVTLTGLTPGTTYDYAVMSANSNGNTSTSANFTFVTTASQPPAISSVSAGALTTTSATITWTTDQASSSQAKYGTTTSYGSTSSLNSSLTTTHSVTLTGLTPGTTYDYAVMSANSNGNTSTSANFTFVTTASQPPVISSVSTSAITTTSATITWTTDQASSSQAKYGTTTSYGSTSTLNSSLTTTHSVTLTGLTPGTTYDYAVISANSNGNASTSANFTFVTTASQPPVISSVAANSLTTTSATITWTTDQASSSQAKYGTTTSYGSTSTLNSSLTTTHSVTLTGLTPGTTYNYAVMSANSNGNASTSANFTFATTASQPPVISSVSAGAITTTSATITWTTDQASSSQAKYGTTTSYGSTSSLNSSLTTTHSVTLTGLTPGTTYNYAVMSANSNGNTSTSANFTFATTAAASGQGPQLSSVAFWGITASSITISWSTDTGSSTTIDYGTTPALGQYASAQPALAVNHLITLTGLTGGTTYYFVAQSTDASGRTSSSTTYSFTTVNHTPPTISNVVVTPGSNGTAVISWSTSTPATSYVTFGSTTNYGKWSNSTPYTQNPQCSLQWAPSGTVHFQLHSIDASGNEADSSDMTFVEP